MTIAIALFGLISSLYLRGNFSVAIVALLQKKVSIAYSNDMITLEQAE